MTPGITPKVIVARLTATSPAIVTRTGPTRSASRPARVPTRMIGRATMVKVRPVMMAPAPRSANITGSTASQAPIIMK